MDWMRLRWLCFSLSLSGATQCWFASLDVSRHRTWDDLAQVFLRQFVFNIVIDVSMRELKALRQRSKDSVTSFISRWREKISQVIDRPFEKDRINMIIRSLQPRFAQHLMGFSHTNFGYLVQTLYAIQEGIARGLWYECSFSDSKGKKPLEGQRSRDVGAISSVGLRPPRHYQTVGQTSGFYYSQSSRVQYRPRAPHQSYDQAYIPPTLALPYHTAQGTERPHVSYSATGQPCYATQFTARPTTSYPRPRAQQTSASFALRTQRQFSQLGMLLSQALQKLIEVGLLTALTPNHCLGLSHLSLG